jgi:hypothetical protein
VILTRLTITFKDNDFLPIFNNSQTAKKFDLIAICPENASALLNLLKSAFRPDIIAFDHEKAQVTNHVIFCALEKVAEWFLERNFY